VLTVTSRYQSLPTAEHQPPGDGDLVPYLTRRFLPARESLTEIGVHVVTVTDRIDRIAAAQFGDPEMFWRIADANPVLRAAELTAVPGRVLLIALPSALVGSPRGF
jgi:hypothetical protein